MEFEIVPYEEVQKLRKINFKKYYESDKYISQILSNEILPSLGITSIHEHGYYMNSDTKTSYMKIIDKQKWFLARIKYGI